MATKRPPLAIVGEAIDQAQPAAKVKRGRAPEEPKLPLLPAGCPVIPLGKSGQVCHYIDEAGQYIALKPGTEHGKGHIINLFGRQAALVHQFWPRYSDKKDPKTQEPIVTGWRPEDAAEALMGACAHAGMFDPQGRIRGRGAHRGEDGALILHCGDKIYNSALGVGRRFQDPGLIDGYVYPTSPAAPYPDPEPAGTEVGEQLLEYLRCWHWERPRIDPYLALGFIAAAPIGGAFDHRPSIWVSGDTETGKSTLEKKLLQPLFEGASLRTHQATEAALRQLLKQQTIPVFFDELEAEENGDRAKAVIGLARLAATGGVVFKGGQDHQGHEFVAQSCFYFSSILIPAMLTQDRNRMAFLELRPIPKGAPEPEIDRDEMLALGRKLRRRLVDEWPRFEATLKAYRTALAERGHSGRGRDQFGTLLACADLLMFDGPSPDPAVVADWAAALDAGDFAETSGNLSDSEEACNFLASTMWQMRGGDAPEPISRFLERAIGAGVLVPGDDCERARETLENHGMKLVNAVPPGADGKPWGTSAPVKGEPLYLAVANSHEALKRMFRDERWAKGVWSQTLGRVRVRDAAGAVIAEAKRRVQVRFAGKGMKATLVPIAALLEREEAA